MRKPQVTGMDKVLENLAKGIEQIEGASERGTLKAAMMIRKRSMKLTPVRLGNLRNSAYVVSPGLDVPGVDEGGGFKGKESGDMSTRHEEDKMFSEMVAIAKSRRGPTSGVGYSAVYSFSVHENPKSGAAGGTALADEARAGTTVPLSQIHSKKGQWKFLEQPLNEGAQDIFNIISREARIK